MRPALLLPTVAEAEVNTVRQMSQDGNGLGKKSRQIDDILRKVFQETLDEEIPDRFKTLLDDLKGKTSDPKGGDDA